MKPVEFWKMSGSGNDFIRWLKGPADGGNLWVLMV